MSNDRQQRAARAEQMRRDREKADRRQRNVITVAIVAVVAVLIGVGSYAVTSASGGKSSPVVQPANATKDHGIVYDAAAAGATPPAGAKPVTVEIYEDFQCPVCKSFEAATGDFLDAQVASGAVTIAYKPFSFLDDNGGSPNRYSHRATNAALCVLADGGASAYKKMHDALYANQPEERTDGPEDDELIDRAKQIGVTGIDSCIRDEKYEGWIDEARAAGEKAGVDQTPTVVVDGKAVSNSAGGAPGVEDLQAAIAAAQA
ncbi:DsbA family protein [Aeromicrobium fastidiosum]|uniref:DsbA family protein n=1 Tax=Aeromicrobium fastidiosum TaxID=52699 RepID=UPI00165F34B3|nr:thioredoxin domain-containing protein [Aeromicrobium fastidiosum]MBP2391991.1 protein-disulfide isomerase [Aeromicrobium fastidiosum]